MLPEGINRCDMRWKSRPIMPLIFSFAVMLILLASAPVSAHFLLNLNVRIFHVDHRADGLDLYVRMPMPYLVADKVGQPGADGLPDPAPFTTNRMEEGRLVHYVDFDQLRRDPLGVGRILVDGLKVETDDGILLPEVQEVRLYALGTEPGFATLEEALAAFGKPAEWPTNSEGLYVGDAVVDVYLHLSSEKAVSSYRISSTLNPGLPDQEKTANLVLDNGPGGVEVFRARGLLNEPIEVSRSSLAAFGTFIMEGVRHILEGLDHVLFVLCLAVGASGITGLLWRVTGFTLGHSVTLSLGFFGFVPSGQWFVPAVELTIALTIIYAAVIAIKPRREGRGESTMFLITSFIGLIHGLGFSFVLQNILKVSAPNIWQSLLAFNIGIELGQLLIVLVAGSLIFIAGRVGAQFERGTRWLVAGSAAVVAFYWAVERLDPLLVSLGAGTV